MKDTAGLSVRGRSLEAPLYTQDDYPTPRELFLVCNSGSTPRISREAHRTVVRGGMIAANEPGIGALPMLDAIGEPIAVYT